MPALRVVTRTPAEHVPATEQLVHKCLGIPEDFPLHRRVEGPAKALSALVPIAPIDCLIPSSLQVSWNA